MSNKSFIFRINDNGEGLDIVRHVCLEKGWLEYDEDQHGQSEWNVWWKSARFRNCDYDSLMPWQRLNHYPKATSITRKDCLARSLKRMKGVYGSSVYNFFPMSFNLPNDYTKFVAEYTKLKSKNDSKPSLWICKPTDLSRGRGIFIFRDLSELQYNSSAVVQRYITNPMLISGYKFDLRIYVAVPSFHPLNIYIHQESIVRFGTEKYDLKSLDNVFSHLTNSSINKFSPNYSAGKERIGPGCKWTLTQLRCYFHQNNVDDKVLWQKIINIITLTLIAQAPHVPKVENCLEFYGFDILVDDNKKPWLVEVNFSPSLSADCQSDYLAKKPVLHDIMDMFGLKEHDMDFGQTKSSSESKSPYFRHHSVSRLSRSRSFQRLPEVHSPSKNISPSPPPSTSKPIFGLPLVQSEDEGCVSSCGDSVVEDTIMSVQKHERSLIKSKTSLYREPSLDGISHCTKTPRSRYSLHKVNSKSSGISDSGVSSFSGFSDGSAGQLTRDNLEILSSKTKGRPLIQAVGKSSLCDFDSFSKNDVVNWRFMIRKQSDTPCNEESNKEPQDINSIFKKKGYTAAQISVSDTRQLSPRRHKKRHSLTNVASKPWLQTSRSRLINHRQVGPKGPAKRYGDFFLVFPFNDATLRVSNSSLDVRVVIREIQKQLKDIAATGGNRDRLWYSVRQIQSD